MLKNKGFWMRISFALSGLRYAFLREKSLRFHAMATGFAILLLLVLQPAIYWWAIVVVTVALVVSTEMLNSAIEGMCDFVQPEYDEKIRYIKDIAAGAVLITSIGALVVVSLLLIDSLS